MRKILALLLTLALLGSGFTAFADIIVEEDGNASGGFGDNNVEVEDTLDDEEIEASLTKPLYFNDFENCGAFTGSNATNGYFTIADFGNSTYGKSVKAGGATWKSVQGSANCGKYTWNGVEYTAFNEPLEQNTDYILAFDYKSDNNDQNYCLSFAPQLPAFSGIYSNKEDWRHNIPASSDWTTYAVKFNSTTATYVNIKINTLSSSATTYIDNYGIYEPVKLTVKGLDAELNITQGVYTDGYLGKGSALVAAAPDGMTIKSATMGGKDIELKDGKIEISRVTGDIEVTVVSGLVNLNKNYLVKNGYVYVPKGQPIATFSEKALVGETYTLTDSEGTLKLHDGILYSSDKLSIKVSSTDTEEFGFKYLLDADGTDTYVVSDVVYLLDRMLGKKTPAEEDDLNGSGILTVSDLVLVRHHILTANGNYSIDKEKLEEEKAKVAAEAESFGITDEMLKASVANVGNRSRVANVMKKALRGENITIATIGGSITEGTGITVADGRAEKCWAALMADWWKRMFPGQVTFVNAGIAGTSSVFGIHRLEDDVLKHDPDLLFIEFAVNDGKQTGSVRSCQEALILKMLERGDAAIQMFFTTLSYNGGGGQETYQPLGEYYDIPGISPRDAFWGKTFENADGKTYDFAGLTADGTHPNIMGNAMVAVLTNNYLNGVYADLTEISDQPGAIPEATFEDDTPNYMDLLTFDPGLNEEDSLSAGGTVTVTDYGCFSKCTDSTTFRSTCDPWYGVRYKNGDIKPMVIDIDNCHVLGISNQTSSTGYKFTVEVFEQGTDTRIYSKELSSNHSSEAAVRTHPASFESVEGKDITVKITPVEGTGDTLTIRNIYIS